MSLAPGTGTPDGAVQCTCVYARLLNTINAGRYSCGQACALHKNY